MIALAAVAGVLGLVAGRMAARRRAEARVRVTRALIQGVTASAQVESREILRAAELGARDEIEAASVAFDGAMDARETELAARDAQMTVRRQALARGADELKARRDRLNEAKGRERERAADAQRVADEIAR